MDNTTLSWIKETKKYNKCPNCEKGILNERIKSARIYKLFLFHKVKCYRCDNCGKIKHFFYKK